MVSCGFNNEKLINMKELALRILQEETDGFESQSRLRDDVLDAMVRFKNESEQLTIPVVIGSFVQFYDSQMANAEKDYSGTNHKY